MSSANALRGIALCAVLLSCGAAFGASYTSAGSGNWNQASTWSPNGVPGAGDDVTITGSDVVTVSDPQFALSVTLDSTTGNKMLVITTGGQLTVARAIEPAITITAPSPGSSNVLRMDGGTLETSNAGISITGGTTAGGLQFTALGGTAKFAGDVLFAGTAANAQIHFGASSGTVEIGGDLGSGGTIVNSTASTVIINGTGAQTVNAYTFHHFEVDKSGGTATLNGPITINGNFDLTKGVLDDGGNQISLNGAGTSATTIGALGVLKLGSSISATSFPTPHGTVTLNPGSAVVYQSGAVQTIQSDFAYRRLYLSTMGGSVDRVLSGVSLTVHEELNIANNGANVVTLLLGTSSLDANGDITGDGTVSVTTGTITIAGNWGNTSVLSAGTSTITYDGTSAQNVLGATYHNLIINKSTGVATLGGNATINGDMTVFSAFSAGANTITFLGDLLGYATVTSSSATFKFTGTSPQIFLNDTAAIILTTLEIDNSSGVNVDQIGLAVNGALNLVNGKVTVPAAPIFVDVLATVNRTNGWIVGPLSMGMNPTPARRFHVGTSASYLPVDVDAGSGGTLTLRAVEGKSPNRSAPNVLERYWTITTPSNVTPIDSITFNYNQTDVVDGDETKYVLARYDGGTSVMTVHGDVVNETLNSATLTAALSSYLGDWIIGQPGSLGLASKLFIASINADTDPQANVPFNVEVDSRDDDGTIVPVVGTTGIELSLDNGTGTLGGTLTGTINAGSSTVTISGATYDTVEAGLILRAAVTSGDALDDATETFNVVAAPTTYTVTSINDSGAGTLRQGILDANSGACANPCTIQFSTSGEINLSTPLPAVVADDVTIDGYTAPGASANTNAFGLPSNAVITVAINGGGTVNVGFDIQATFVTVKGFAIKNFTNAGVVFQGDNSGSNVSGCYIGTTTSGMVAAPNAIGVLFSGSAEASVGGFTPAARNVISGNTTSGIETAAAANTIGIYGNYIGVKADLTTQLPNNTGVKVCSGCSSIVVGASSAGNVISGNTGSGLVLAGGGVTVKKNYIGTAGSSNSAIPNATGVQIDSGSNFNTIGGPSPSDTNVISGNTQNGILINGDDNTIDNNLIGIAPDGSTSLGNGGHGIRLENNAARNAIGTSIGNKIAFNLGDGVSVATTSTGIGNTIRRSKIAGNSDRAIDLGDNGFTLNDATDTDTGANNLQNYPAISSAVLSGGNLAVKATLNSSGGTNVNGIIVDVYKAVSGQAELHLGSSACIGGNAFTNLVINIAGGSVSVGNSIVATATAYSDACVTPSEGTSELSPAATVAGDIHWIAGSGNWETASNWSPAVVPGVNDNAIIDNTGTYTVAINSNVSVASLQLGAASGTQTLQVNSFQSLSLSSGSAVYANGVLTFDGNSMGGSGALSVFGTMNWSTGTLTGTGGFVVESGGTLNINGASLKTVNGPNINIASGGTANWTGGNINVANAGSFDNAGLFDITTDASLSDSGFAGTFDNTGTFRKKTTAGTTTVSNLTVNHNGGTMDIQTGILNLAGGSATASITIATGAELLIDDNTFTLGAGSSIAGNGKVHINGGTLAVTGAPVAIEHLLLDSGTLGGTGTATTSGTATWVWNGGSMAGGGSTTILSGTTLQISTASAKALNNRTLTVQNGGTLTINGSGGINLQNGGTISNAGLVVNSVDVTISDIGLDGGISNSGEWRKTGGTGSTTISNIDFTNTGTLKVLSGTFNPGNLTNSGIIEITGATFLVDESTVALSAGSDVQSSGLLRIAGGTLSVNTSDALPNVQIDSGFLSGTGTHDIQTLTWNSGTLAGTGTTTIPNTATVTFASASAKGLQRTLSIAAGGTATVTGSGSINLSAGGNIANAGLFDTTVDVQIGDAGGDGGFSNTGTFRKSGGAGSTTLANVDLTSSGTLDVQTGTLNPGAVTSTGNITLTGTLLIDDNTVTLSGGDVSGSGLLRIAGGTLAANATDTFPNVQIDSGTMNGSGNVSITSLLWNSGTMSGAGTTTIPSGATATLATASAKSLQRTFTVQNGGTMHVTGSGALNFASGGNIANDGLINVTSPVSFNDSSLGGDVANTRTFRVNVTGSVVFANTALNNTGASALIDIVSGSLDLADGTSSGAIAIAGGADLRIDSHTYVLAAGTTVTGGGAINLTAGTLSVTGNVSVPSLAQSGGIIDGSGTLTYTGTASWSAGTMQGGGTTTVANGAALTLTSASPKSLNNRTLSTAAGGTINVTGTGSISLSNGGNIANGGLFHLTADNSIADASFGGSFVNTGTLRKSVATGTTTFSSTPLSNNGGVIDLQRGIVTVNDAFTQTAGTLKIWLNGTTAGSGFGQLTSNTSATLGGTLEIALVSPYEPVGGNTFRVLAIPARTGDFTQPYTYPALSSGRTFSDAYDGSGLLLTVSGNGDLSIDKSAPANVAVGGAISYTLSVSNAGPDVANGVSVTDVLQTGHSGISASGTGWTCNVVSLTVTCTAASLNVGAAPAIIINATAPTTAQTFTNVANVDATNDPNGANDSDSAVVTVDPLQADVEVTVSGPGAPHAPSAPLQLDFEVRNNGPQTASNVSFSAPIPASLTYNNATPDSGTCNFSAGTVTCSLGNILTSGVTHILIDVTTTTAAGTHTVSGTASATEGDPVPSNNSIGFDVQVPGGTLTVTNVNDAGAGSLRQALEDAQNGLCSPLPCIINFNIAAPPYVIQPQTDLPFLDDQITLDGTSQPGYPANRIQIDAGANDLFVGLALAGNNSVVKGLSVTGAVTGIDISGNGNAVEASYIGLDALGNAAGNDAGVEISGNNNTIGGSTAAQRNVISASAGSGVFVYGSAGGNVIAGNFIGTDPAGTAARPNNIGVSVTEEADGNTIGGATPAHGNVISGNANWGVYIAGDGTVVAAQGVGTNAAGDGIVDNTQVLNNFIGPAAGGTAALGHITAGLSISDNAKNTLVQGNAISGNANGITLDDAQVTGSSIIGNLIGLAPDGLTPMANSQAGIVSVAGTGNLISGNSIAHNGGNGLTALGGVGNRILSNEMHDNAALGIDLAGDGVDPIDAGDADTGPNGKQNAPLLTSVSLLGGGNVHAAFNLDSSAATPSVGSVYFELFEADTAGEGKTFLAGTCVAGNAFSSGLTFNDPSVAAGDPIVATATSYGDAACGTVADGTSEFSNIVNAAACTPPAVTITGPTATCAGGSVTLDAGAGFSSYSWSNGVGVIGTGQQIVVTPTANTTYTVTVTNAVGCANSDTHTVTVNPLPSVTITGPTSVCAGGSVTLNAGAGFASYSWSDGVSVIGTGQQITVSPTANTTYTVTVTDGNSCQGTDSHAVSITAAPAVTITGPTSTCSGNSVTLDAGPGFASYSWSDGVGVIGTGQQITVSPTANTTYSVVVSDGQCNATDTHTVTVTATPAATISASGPTTFCAGGSVTLTASSGTAWSWSNGASTQSITVTNSGNFSVQVFNGSCSATSAPTAVTVNPAPAVTIVGPANVCAGGSVTLDAGPGFATYSWSDGVNAIGSGQQIVVSPTANTTYQVTVTDGSGCSGSDTHVVSVTSTPTVTITGPTSICAGGPVTLDAGPGFASYSWSDGVNVIGSSQTIVVTPSATTTYSVTVSDGSCTATDTHTVTANAPPAATISASGPTTFCAGGSVTLTASSGTAWSWSNGASTQSITVSNSGTFSVQVFDGSCSATSAPVAVTVNPAPVVNITGPAATCVGAPVTLDAGPGFATYSWSDGVNAIGSGQQITVSPSSTTTYSVTVTNGSGCSAVDTHTVAVATNPAAVINAPASICESSFGNAANIAPQANASYVWTISGGTIEAGQGTNAILFSPASNASVVLGVTVNAGACTSTGSVTIPVVAAPSAAISAPATAAPNQTGLVASVPANANATFNWTVTNGSIDSGQGTNQITFSAGASGFTTVAVNVSVGGCVNGSSRDVTIDAPSGSTDADMAITKSAPAAVQQGGTIVYTIGVTNHGPAAATDVLITDVFPAGTSFVSVSGGPWNCTRTGAGIRCLGSAAAGASSIITLTLTAPQQPGTIVNTVDVIAGTPDPNGANNSASAATTVLAPSPTCATAPPSLLTPAGAATVASPAMFSWQAVVGAIEYELWIDSALAATTNATSITRPLGAGAHSWFIVARLAAGCDPLTSATRTFNVAAAPSCPTAAPQLATPSNVTGSQVSFTWSAVPQAIGYRLWIEANGTAAQDVGTTDGATTLTVTLPTGAIVAYVDALFSGCEPTRSARVTFNVPAPDPCAASATASPLAPANNAVINSSSIEFAWTRVAGAAGYRVWYSVDGGDPAVLGFTTTETSLRGAIARGFVVWWIEVLFDGCASTESQRFRFTIPARNDCTDARPAPLAPSNNSSTSSANTTFTWSAVPNAISYELWVGVDNGTPVLFGTTSGTSLARIVPPGRIDWNVVAVVDRCGARESQTFRFTYTPPASCTFVRPSLVAPLNGARVNAPVDFSWNAVSGATGYELYVVRGGDPALVTTTTATEVNAVPLASGAASWFVRALFGGGCSPVDSEVRALDVVTPPPACAVLAAPALYAPGQISSGVPFLIQWTPVSGATSYQLQIASRADFADAQIVTTAGMQHQIVRTNNGSSAVAVHTRVRAVDGRCEPVPAVSPYGAASAIFILPSSGAEGSTPVGGSNVTLTIVLGSEFAGQTFTAVPKQPWLTVSPASGVVGAGGTTLTVVANTAGLPVGTSLGGVSVTLSAPGAGGVAANSTTTMSNNFSISLVTPVTPSAKNTPPPDALIIPAVAHAGGINSQFQSDVRVSNTSAQLITYEMTFTPSGDSGITQGQQTTFSIEPGRTVALDDILRSWFGTGDASAIGTLEIRPLTQLATSTPSSSLSGLPDLVTFASSRTYNLTANGTFGQFIPAIPFANFIGQSAAGEAKKILSLQQIAQSSKYRTNLGVVEGSGNPASLLVRVFGASGEYLTEFPVELRGGQHLQMNAFLRNQGIDSLSDGRVEVEVVSGDGKVTAYASVLDNVTSDPLLVTPVTVDDLGATKWVVPGVADLTSGFANWQTDMRLFNAGTAPVEATLSFHSQSGAAPKVKTLTIGAGQVLQFDRALAALFDLTNDGGAVHVATAAPARLVATARTYNQTGNGTYGQFISAVTPAEAAGVGSRPLQLLQVEETDRFRSNIGLVEVTGKPVTIELTVVPPDAKFTAVTELQLNANEFRQLGSLLRSMGLADTYNARVTVRAIDGEGRVTAYASVIDMQTNDPTYMPAQ